MATSLIETVPYMPYSVNYRVVVYVVKLLFDTTLLQIIVTSEGTESILFVEFNKAYVSTSYPIQYRLSSGYGVIDASLFPV